MLRLFVACDIEDPGVIERLVGFQRSVLWGFDRLKLVEPENLHFTLAFLGEQRESELEKILHTLSKVEPVGGEVEVRGVSAFPSTSNPRVVFAEVTRGAEILTENAERVREALDGASVWYDRAPFKPHLTLARLKSADRKLASTLMLHMDDEFGVTPVSGLRLKKSELRPSGPVYTTIQEYRVKGEKNGSG
ncbi:MAG: RNA 2',3'-cyclic phosphodiesterase [Thermoprotei archaeon]